MKMYCDNQVDFHIASNSIFHERTKHTEIECHFIWERLFSKEICTKFIKFNDQLTCVNKILKGFRLNLFVSSLVYTICMFLLDREC